MDELKRLIKYQIVKELTAWEGRKAVKRNERKKAMD